LAVLPVPVLFSSSTDSRLAVLAIQGNGFGRPAIRHDHIRNDVEVKSMAGSVVQDWTLSLSLSLSLSL
jgi:hypothetical protein